MADDDNLSPDETARVLAHYRAAYNYDRIQYVIQVLAHNRDYAAERYWHGTAAHAQEMLLLAAQVRDELRALARDVDDATNPFRVLDDDDN